MMEIACDRKDRPNAIAAFRELCNRLIGKPAEEPRWDDASGPQYPILVTTTAEALKKWKHGSLSGMIRSVDSGDSGDASDRQ